MAPLTPPSLSKIATTSALWYAGWLAVAWAFDMLPGWRIGAASYLLGLAVNVWVIHRLTARANRALADAPAIIQPDTEVAPGTMMIALVAAWGERPWWAPWRPCHSDHLTLAETTVDRPLEMPVQVGVNGDVFVVLDALGVLLEVDGWTDRLQPGATVTTVVRTI